ncbi:MAG: SurA N-terminal domain-containing protein [Desulfopila sp.]|jgi:peptidyl-prolyl cis-trans isomerase D|nr:SurA N-terminal domain-containing protein [Desulfopila sp.]
MLQILRNKAQSIIIQIIVVIIALVFIFWGVGTNLMNNREAAIVVNDEEISFQDYQMAYDRMYNSLQNQFGASIPQELLESFGIKNQVINQLIQEALLRQGAAEMGIHVSSSEVQETIKNMPQFQENGTFNLERYTTLLNANGFTPVSFEESMRHDILSQKAQMTIGGFATTVTDFEILDLYRLEKSSVAVKYAEVSAADYVDEAVIDEKLLEEWYTTVQDNYKTEREIKLKFLDFSYDTVGQMVSVDQETIEQYYRENVTEFMEAEQRRARHILFPADENSTAEVHNNQKKKAEEILELARDGANFAELARKYSEGPSKDQGGDLGFFSQDQMVTPFADAAFSLEKGGISDIVQTSFGYHIIKIEEITPAVTRPMEEVQETIRAKLQADQARPLAFQAANEAYEGIISAGSLEAYLQANQQARLQETEFFDRRNPPESIGNDPKFLNAAFSLKEQELSSLIETSQGYAILFVEAEKQPVVPELSAVREKIAADFKQAESLTSAKEAAETLLDQAQAGEGLQKAAENSGISVEESDYLSRSSSGSQALPAEIVEEAFQLSAKEPYPEAPLQNNSTFYVLEFADMKIPSGPLSDEEKSRYSNAILQLKQQQVLSGWLANRREQAEIFTHRTLSQ